MKTFIDQQRAYAKAGASLPLFWPSGRFVHCQPLGGVLILAPCLPPSQPDDSIMREEIFGPLPQLTYRNIEQPCQHSKSGGKPLSLYVFSQSRQLQRRVLNSLLALMAVLMMWLFRPLRPAWVLAGPEPAADACPVKLKKA